MSLFEYRASLLTVVDGDTVDLEVDCGFRVYKQDRFRLAGLNTPELRSSDPAERVRAKAAREYLTSLLDVRYGGLRIRTLKDAQEKFGRYLVHIYCGEVDVNAELIRTGHAVPYMLSRP